MEHRPRQVFCTLGQPCAPIVVGHELSLQSQIAVGDSCGEDGLKDPVEWHHMANPACFW